MLKLMNNSSSNYEPSTNLNIYKTSKNPLGHSLTNTQRLLSSTNQVNRIDSFRSSTDVNKSSVSKLNPYVAKKVIQNDSVSGSDNDSFRNFNSSKKLLPKTDVKSYNNDEFIPKQMYDNDKFNSSVPSKINKNFLDKMKRKHKYKITANISGTKFEIIRHVLESIGCKIVSDENFDSNLIWDDTRVSVEGVSELKPFQRFNHFPAMSEISRKDALAKNILKICKVLPREFDFVPKTWVMPGDYSSLLTYANEMKKYQQKKTYIMKPSNGAMGHGIKLFRNVDKIQPTENFVVQEYISNPYLLDGFKFDLRIYALVTSCDPLRAFIFNNGLVRLGTELYQEPNESNIDHLFMHLTNYSVNKRNKHHYDEGDPNGETGTKRSLKFLFDHFRRNNIDSSKIWKNIQDIILKTLLVAEPYLFHTYKMCRPGQIPGTDSVCYEILGFDILLDDKLKPWVIEVNRSPSFGANQQIDFDIKSRLLVDTFELLHFKATDRHRSQTMEKLEAKKRLYNFNSFSSKNDLNSFEQKGFLGSYGLNSAGVSSSLNMNNNSNANLNSNKKVRSKEKRKMELIDQIKLLRREQKRQDFENRNLGNFSRLFPIDDKYDMEYYLNILNTAFNLFYPIGKHIQWKKTYERIKEEELLNELVECDENLYDESDYDQYRKINEYLKDDYMTTDTEEESHSSSENEDNEYHHSRHHDTYQHYHQHHFNSNNHFAQLKVPSQQQQQQPQHPPPRSISIDSFKAKDDYTDDNLVESKTSFNSGKRVSLKSLVETENIKQNRVNTLMNSVTSTRTSTKQANNRKTSEIDLKTNEIMNANKTEQQQDLLKQMRQHQNKINRAGSSTNLTPLNPVKSKETNQSNAQQDQEEISTENLSTLTVACLKLLGQLEIKFPGKTNEQTKSILQKIYSKLEAYKPKLADYWMVKLDDTKRTKILNIVKSNIIVILQKVFLVDSVENLRLYKIFIKLINRLLWMHGQGLWNCFASSNNSSWESIFNKSSFQITENELKCCYRIVELCKDCVVIVYQYAFENKPNLDKRNTPSNISKYKTISVSNSSLNVIKKIK